MKEIKLKNIDYETFDWTKIKDYEVVCDGTDEIVVVHNYPQEYLYNIRKDFNEKEIEYMGYKIVEGDPKNDSVVLIQRTENKFHVVKPSETLSVIAQKYNTTIHNLKTLNSIKEVFIGQIIKVRD